MIQAGGYKAAYAGNKNFIVTWKRIAKEKAFQDAYDDFLLKREIFPVYTRMDKSGNVNLDKLTSWASEDNAIQAAVKSTIIQHGQGGAYRIFQSICSEKAVLTKPTQTGNDPSCKLLPCVYKQRRSGKLFRSSAAFFSGVYSMACWLGIIWCVRGWGDYRNQHKKASTVQ